MTGEIRVAVVDNAISAGDVEVATPRDGAVVTFAGIVRDHSEGRDVTELEYEAYSTMAADQIRGIAEQACRRWPVTSIAIIHRTGRLAVGETSVVVAVSAPHRAEAFDACRYCIDTLKTTAAIWKKEHFADGSAVWVDHP